MSAPKRLSLPNRWPIVAAVSTRPRPFTMGVYPPIPLRVMVGRSPAVLVTRFTEPPIPSASMLAWRVLLISTDSTMSAGMASSLIWRTPDSGEGTLMPLMVTLVSRGSVPRTCTYLPSPSSRSKVTLGKRPRASAILALGRLRITSEVSTCTRLSAVSWRLISSASPEARSAVTRTSRF